MSKQVSLDLVLDKLEHIAKGYELGGHTHRARAFRAAAKEIAYACQPARDEVGWVVEKRGKLPVEYVCASSAGFEFTTDNLKAIRFCRREDANQIAEILDGEDVAIVEHMWCRGAAINCNELNRSEGIILREERQP